MNLKYYVELTSSLAITLSVVFSYLQIRKISKSIEISNKSNLINVLNCFTKEYNLILVEAGECLSNKKVNT